MRKLSEYGEIVRDILTGEIEVEGVQTTDITVTLELQRQHGLLTIDSITLAVARRLGITEIAAAGKSFDNVRGIIIYKPEDMLP